MAQHGSPEEGYRVLSYLIGGVLLYGGIGWLLDQWLNTKFCMPIGIVLGAAAAIYVIYKRNMSAT